MFLNTQYFHSGDMDDNLPYTWLEYAPISTTGHRGADNADRCGQGRDDQILPCPPAIPRAWRPRETKDLEATACAALRREPTIIKAERWRVHRMVTFVIHLQCPKNHLK